MGGAVHSRWSPDGHRIAFEFKEWKVDARYHVYVVDAQGGSPRRIASGDFDEWTPAWSGDGGWIYFMSDRGDGCSLWKAPIGGGAPARVLRRCGRFLGESEDGAAVFYSARGRVFEAPAPGGDTRLLLETSPGALLTLAKSGLDVFDPHARGGPAIALFSLATRRLRTLLTLPAEPLHRYIWGANGFAVSPDERFAFFEHLDGRDPDIMLVEGFR
jgi:TolB protein